MKHILSLLIALLYFQTLSGMETLIIGIAGGTGSGKTTLAKKIAEAFPGQAVLISHDSYYKELSHLSVGERGKTNFDHPDSIDFELLIQQLDALRQGHPIEKPVYNFHRHTREDYNETVGPNKIIIVEGILLFAIPEVCERCDLKLFVETDDDVRLLRRIDRDVHERSRSFESVCNQYLATVKPMHEVFVQPSKKQADLIIPRGGENPWALELILSKLKKELEKID